MRFVTALFAPPGPQEPYRKLEEYLELFAKFPRDVPRVVFTSPDLRERVVETAGPDVVVVDDVALETLPPDAVLPSQRWDKKDTPFYFAVQLTKLKVLARAAELFPEEQFLSWVDFGIFHQFRSPERTSQLLRVLATLRRGDSAEHRVLSPSDFSDPLPFDVMFDRVCWRHLGSMLVGPPSTFRVAYARQRALLRTHAPRVTWEVNYWLLMPEYFELYRSSHDDTLVSGAIEALVKKYGACPPSAETYGVEALREVAATAPVAQSLLANWRHFVGLLHACGRKGDIGSYLIDGVTYSYEPRMLQKQQALFECGRRATRVLEVGVYMGHSLLILLLANPELRITCVDIDGTFPTPAVEYLNTHFGNRVTLLLGDAVETLRSLAPESDGSFDLVHIDADHYADAVLRQYRAALRLAAPGAAVVFDDYDAVSETVDALKETDFAEFTAPDCAWRNAIAKLKPDAHRADILRRVAHEETARELLDVLAKVPGDVVQVGLSCDSLFTAAVSAQALGLLGFPRKFFAMGWPLKTLRDAEPSPLFTELSADQRASVAVLCVDGAPPVRTLLAVGKLRFAALLLDEATVRAAREENLLEPLLDRVSVGGALYAPTLPQTLAFAAKAPGLYVRVSDE